MKILIIGPLGAGKSSLAYAITQKFKLSRLNLDEFCRRPDSSYYSHQESFTMMDVFLQNTPSSWVAEGCQKYLYERLDPDLIIDMRINRLVAIWRFTIRFIKAKKLIGKVIDKDLPVQAYHYRKITLAKILDWDKTNKQINDEIKDYLSNNKIQVIKCKSFKDYSKIFNFINKNIVKSKD